MNNNDAYNLSGMPPEPADGTAEAVSQAQQLHNRLPRPIVEKLQLLITRIRRIVLLKGLLIVAATAMGLILALMAIDASVVMLPQPVQAALSLGALLTTIAVAWRFLFRPLRRKHTLVAVARVLENRHPQLEERISSALDLLGSSDPTSMKGSELLIMELVKAAEIDASELSPKMEFTIRSAKPYLIAVSSMAGVVALLFLLWPQSISRLLTRALVPYANVGNVSSTLLTVTPGSTRIAIGEALTISVAIQVPGLSRAELRFVGEKGIETIERMGRAENSPAGVSTFSTKFPAVESSFRYRVRAGRALSAYYLIRVERRPEVESCKVSYEYPSYSGLAQKTEEGVPGDITAPAGSKIKLSAQFNKSLVSADLIVNGKPVTDGADSTAGGKPVKDWHITLARGLTGIWSFNLVDDIGMTNRRVDRKILTIPDVSPTVELSEPIATTLKLKPTELIPISFFARDDYGIQAAVMFVTIDNGKAVAINLDPPRLSEAKRGLWSGEARLNLAALDLSTAKKVSMRIGVTDNLPADLLGPQTGFSQMVSIDLDQQAPALSRQTIATQDAQIRADLAMAKAKLEAARKKAPSDDEQARGVEPRLPDIKDIHQLSGDAETILRKLAAETGEGLFAQLARPLTRIADDHVEPARRSAEMIPLSDNATDRDKNVTSMKKHLDAAIAALNTFSQQVDKAKENAQNLADMKELANRQDQLAKEAKALADKPQVAGKTDAKKWKDAQDELLKKLADMVKQDPMALRKQMEESQKEAQQLAGATKQLADQQKALADQRSKSDNTLKQQGEIAQKAGDIKDDVGKLADKMEKLGDDKAKTADSAEQSIESAGKDMKTAMDKMAQQPQDQQTAQQDAGKQLEEASDKLAQLAKAIEKDNKKSDKASVGSVDQPAQQAAKPTLPTKAKGPRPHGKVADPAEPPNALPAVEQADSKIEHTTDENMDVTPADADQKQDESAANADEPDTDDTGSGGAGGKGNTSPGETKAPPTPKNPKPGGPDKGVGSDTGSGAPGSGSKGKGEGSGEPSTESSSEASSGTPGSTPAPGIGKAAPSTSGQKAPSGGKKPAGPAGKPPAPPSGEPDSADSLANAFDQAADAAGAGSMSQAAPSAAQAARELAQLASSTAEKMGMKSSSAGGTKPGSAKGSPGSPGAPGQPGQPGQPGPSGSQPSPSQDGSGTPTGSEQGLAGGDWLQPKGTLSGNVRDSSEETTTADYRDLVKDYFLSVAREGNKPK